MTTDEIVLHEAERWFRSKLRNESALLGFEERLFSAIAGHQMGKAEAYTPRERPPDNLSALVLRTVDPLPTTMPPPPDIQRELLRVSRVEIVRGGVPTRDP